VSAAYIGVLIFSSTRRSTTSNMCYRQYIPATIALSL